MKISILSIDDSKAVQSFLGECVKDIASEFVKLPDGDDAVKYMSTTPTPQFDIIFLDWEMPIKTGPETLKEFRRMGIKTPVIMLTSKNESGDIAKLLSEGADEYIMKPFTKDIILEKVKFILEGGF